MASSVLNCELFGKPSVAYWLGRDFWGQGMATRALAAFVQHVHTQPLYPRVAKDNVASLRMLTKCGFAIHGEDSDFATARGQEVEEYIPRLDANTAWRYHVRAL